MDFRDVSLTALRVFRLVAERGTLTAAATVLGYTQSAVSRQIATLERAAGAPLLERRHDGVRLTPAGHLVLRRAASVVDQIDAGARELAGLPAQTGTVRLGWLASFGITILPAALTRLARDHPAITVTTREGTTPALVRALRAGSIDLALLGTAPPYHPPDDESPPLVLTTVLERSLRVAVPTSHPLARGDFIDADQLRGQRWIAGPHDEANQMGVWPGVEGRPDIAHTARDWMAKLHLVAAGCGITTLPAALARAAPSGVRVLPVRGGPQERRRFVLARLPGPLTEPAAAVAEALRAAATDIDAPR